MKFEQTVFEMVLQWVNKDVQSRKPHFPILFKYVRLQHIPINYVAGTIRKDVSGMKIINRYDLYLHENLLAP